MRLTIEIEIDVLTEVAAKAVVEDFFMEELEEVVAKDGLRIRRVLVNLEQRHEKPHPLEGRTGMDGSDQ